MNSQTRSLMRPMTILVPLILIVALFGSYLRAEMFYRMAFHAGMDFYVGYIRAHVIEYGGRYNSTGQNDSFIVNAMYYPLLDSGGVNLPQTCAPWDWLYGHDNLWGNQKVYQSELGEVGRYSAAQYKDYSVGTNEELDYFRHPRIGVVGPDPDGYPFYEIIFYCDTASWNAGYIIDTTFWKWDQCMDHRLYHVEMKLKVRNPVSMDSNFIRLEFGAQDEADLPPESLFPHEYFGTGVYPSDTSGTDDIRQYFLAPGQLSGIGVYDTVCFSDSFSLRQKQTVFKLYWYDTADLYLDWIRVYDEEYRALVMVDSQAVRTSIKSDARSAFNPDRVYSLFFDEPWPVQHRAQQIVDSLCQDTSGGDIRLLGNLPNTDSTYWGDYLRRVGPEVFVTNYYTLTPEISSVTDTTDSISLQRAWDRLEYWETDWDPVHAEDDYHRGFLQTALTARRYGVPWYTEIQSMDEWSYHIDNPPWWDHWHRDPTANELTCIAYMALSFGAKGMGYYHAAPYYAYWSEPNIRHIILNDSTADSGYCASRGFLDLKTADGDFPVPDDFPYVFTTGKLVPNYKYYAIRNLHDTLDVIDTVLLGLDWDTSFCVTNGIRLGHTKEDFIDSVWTVGDDYAIPPYSHWIDSTFVQVGLFDCDPQYTIDEYLMFVNRRCLDSETRTVHARFDFGEGNSNRCLSVEDYLGTIHKIHCCTNDTGVVEDFSVSLAPGHGKLFRIHNSVPVCGNVDSGDTLTWAADTTVWVVDTLEVEGTLIIEEGATVKVCDVTEGIIVKPEGHLSILGTEQNPVTIEEVNPDSLKAHIKLYGEGTDTIQYCNISNLNWGVAIGEKRTLVLKNCNISHCNSGVVSVGDGTLYMDSCTVDSCNWEGNLDPEKLSLDFA